MENKVNTFILNRAFFGKINCLKILMNSEKEVYFHIGLLKMGNWEWKKVKMSDNELGEIIGALSKCDGACAFYHKYNDKKAQIWVKKSEKSCNVKINEVSKNLTIGEFEVLRIILEQCVRMMNF
jgi:hypothetical protein